MSVIKLKKKPSAPTISEALAPFENENAAKLGKIVVDIIAAEPFKFEGFVWAAKHQPELASQLGMSVAALRRLITKPPFVRERTHDGDGKPITLLRVGMPGPKTPRHLANIMAQFFHKKFGTRPTDKAFGCLCGLAEIWPNGKQIDIFKTVLANWEGFMGVAKLELEIAEDQGLLTFKNLKFDFLPIPLLRIDCVAAAAVEFHIAEMQSKKTWNGLSATMPST